MMWCHEKLDHILREVHALSIQLSTLWVPYACERQMLTIETAELQKHRLFIGSPQHGGNCHSIFTTAFGDVMMLAGQYRLPVDTYLLWNESMGKIIMTTAQQVTDLTAAVGVLAANFTTMTGNITTNDAAIQAELVALKAAVAASAGGAAADPAVQASIDNISALSKSAAVAAASIATETAALTASIAPPAPAPAA